MWMRKKEKAVYTVEAALIMPLVLLVVLLAVRVGVDLHTKVKDASCHYEKLEQYDAPKEVKKERQIKKIIGE
uniref:hypothetical protein n=1 Tax=Roseburia hominis TaxID=301301 RepID=UPI001F1FE0B5